MPPENRLRHLCKHYLRHRVHVRSFGETARNHDRRNYSRQTVKDLPALSAQLRNVFLDLCLVCWQVYIEDVAGFFVVGVMEPQAASMPD